METYSSLRKQIASENDCENCPISTIRGDTIIQMSGFDEFLGGYYNEYPPGLSFYSIRKKFYSNGLLKSKGMYAGEYAKVGVWQYYDIRGNLIKEVDENVKYGKINLDWILNFLKKEGWDNWDRENYTQLELVYEEISEKNDIPFWHIYVYYPFKIYYYLINGATGDLLKKTIEDDPSRTI